jgi:hypothetical protein
MLSRSQRANNDCQCSQEEFEDSMGNVVNKRTYDDLRKQGLL